MVSFDQNNFNLDAPQGFGYYCDQFNCEQKYNFCFKCNACHNFKSKNEKGVK